MRIALAVVLVASVVSAEQRDPVPTTAPRPAAVATTTGGTGSLSGRLAGDATGRPVRRAIVTLTGSELTPSRSAITDDEGRFAFSGLPAGRFNVTATKPAHLTTAYGARQPGRPGTPVSVSDGQQVANINFQLPAGGVITGTVRNQYGEPMSGVSIIAGRPQLDRPGAGQSAQLGQVVTDDRGVFRLYGLEPGSYFVGAQIRFSQGAMNALSEREVNDALASLQRAAPAPGRSAPAAPLPPAPPSPLFAMAPIFFPGTPDFSAAQQIAIRVGEERTGVDIVLREVRAVRVSGTVSVPNGELPTVQLGFASDVTVALAGYSSGQPSLVQQRDGHFSYTGVIPGRYTITARTAAGRGGGPGTTVVGGGGGRVGGVANVPAVGETQWASATVTVTDADIEGVALALGPGLRLPGRLEFDATTLPPPTNAGDIRLTLQPRREGGLSMINGTIFGTVPPPPAEIAADRTLTFRGLLPGVFTLTSGWAAGKGWWLRSAVANGTDILDVPLEITPDGQAPPSIVVTYSDRQTELSGVLQTAGGAPAPDYFIVAFSTDPRTWRPQARRISSTRPATDGAFFIRDLPPGEYHLAALTDLDPAEWQTPAFLSQLAPVALKFTLTDGQKLRQDLRVQ